VLGLVVYTLKQKWAESDFSMSAEDMLQQLPYILSEVGVKPSRQVDWLQKCGAFGLQWKIHFCSVIQRLLVICIAYMSHIIWPFPTHSCILIVATWPYVMPALLDTFHVFWGYDALLIIVFVSLSSAVCCMHISITIFFVCGFSCTPSFLHYSDILDFHSTHSSQFSKY